MRLLYSVIVCALFPNLGSTHLFVAVCCLLIIVASSHLKKNDLHMSSHTLLLMCNSSVLMCKYDLLLLIRHCSCVTCM